MQIARLFGVPVRLDWTWPMGFAVFAWIAPVKTAGFLLGAALAGMLLQETVHVLAARKEGIRTQFIVLYPFGCVARTEARAADQFVEIRLALVGPAAVFACGCVCGLIAALYPAGSQTFALIAAAAVVLSAIAAVNLLPLHPLDGSRIFHAMLWQRSCDFEHAAAVGGVLTACSAWGLALVAVTAAVFQQPVLAIGLAALSWFAMQRRYGGMEEIDAPHTAARRCIELMDRPGSSLQPDITCADALHLLINSGRRYAPIVVGRKFIGLVSLNDFARLGSRDAAYVYVSSIMTRADELVVLQPATSVSEALKRLSETGCDQLPVIGKAGALLGFVNRRAHH